MWAAILRPFSTILRAATAQAPPPTGVVRLPYVPHPIGVIAVSPQTTWMSSMGTPNSSATICANVVSSPCPWGFSPMNTFTFPVGCTRITALPHNPPWKPTASPATRGPSR